MYVRKYDELVVRGLCGGCGVVEVSYTHLAIITSTGTYPIAYP